MLTQLPATMGAHAAALCKARRPIAILIQDRQFEPAASVWLRNDSIFVFIERIRVRVLGVIFRAVVCPDSEKRAITLGEMEGATWSYPFRDEAESCIPIREQTLWDSGQHPPRRQTEAGKRKKSRSDVLFLHPGF